MDETLKQALPHLDVRMAYENDYPEEWLQPGGGSDLLVYRGFMYADMDDDGQFIKRICESGAKVINTFETEIRSNKRWFALLPGRGVHRLCPGEEILDIKGGQSDAHRCPLPLKSCKKRSDPERASVMVLGCRCRQAAGSGG